MSLAVILALTADFIYAKVIPRRASEGSGSVNGIVKVPVARCRMAICISSR